MNLGNRKPDLNITKMKEWVLGETLEKQSIIRLICPLNRQMQILSEIYKRT